MKKLALLFGLLLAFPAFAADNAVIVTPGVGVTMKSKDIGAGVQAMQPVLSDTGGNALSTPTAGADAVSNTSTGLLSYSRNLVWNGTTWDRWTGDLTNGGWVNVKASALPSGGSTSANQTTINTSIGTTNTNLGAQADTAAAADNSTASLIALLKRTNQNLTTLNTSVGAAVPAGTNTIGTVGQLPYPVGAVPLTASATGTTAATTATLAGAVGKTTYICGYSIRANATAAATVTNTITGVITATMSSIMWVPANTAGLGVDEQIFSPCIPASSTNQAIAVVSGAPGTGGLVSSKGWGYQL